MTETTTTRSVEHATFVLDRVYPVPRERVYAAMANKELKAKWFGSEDGHVSWDFDFREGGRELHSGLMTMPNGEEHHSKFDAYYLDIVENERITWSYNMYMNGVKRSSSLTVVELTTVPGARSSPSRRQAPTSMDTKSPPCEKRAADGSWMPWARALDDVVG